MNGRVADDQNVVRVPLGGDYWTGDPGTPLWGFADLHAHLMAHLAFGGKAFWGQPYDPDHAGEEALRPRPRFVRADPRRSVQRQSRVRSFAGRRLARLHPLAALHHADPPAGLYRLAPSRLSGWLAADHLPGGQQRIAGHSHEPHRDARRQQRHRRAGSGMKATVAHVDRQSGGEGNGWLQIAYTPEDARTIIGHNKLAVILGVEVDSLGNWSSRTCSHASASRTPIRARVLIAAELDWLYGLGVRQITPVHLTDNAFGGTAIYLRVLEAINIFVAGRHWEVERCLGLGRPLPGGARQRRCNRRGRADSDPIWPEAARPHHEPAHVDRRTARHPGIAGR